LAQAGADEDDLDSKQLITVHLKNDVKIEGVLKSMDQQMNMELTDLNVASLPPPL
jgi:small nuclear ribonucleoprotein (snRNP)-like protein